MFNKKNEDCDNLNQRKTEILMRTKEFTIYYDEKYKVRIKIKQEEMKDIVDVERTVMEINNLPLSSTIRRNYGQDIANIYKIAYLSGNEEAIKMGKELKAHLEYNLIVYKKIEFILPCVIFTIISILIGIFFKFMSCELAYSLIYGPIGGILSIAVNQNQLKIDYKVENKIIIIEAAKMIALSVIMAEIGFIAIKSQMIFGDIDFDKNNYKLFLSLIMFGYSQNFIPNLLDKLGSTLEKRK